MIGRRRRGKQPGQGARSRAKLFRESFAEFALALGIQLAACFVGFRNFTQKPVVVQGFEEATQIVGVVWLNVIRRGAQHVGFLDVVEISGRLRGR